MSKFEGDWKSVKQFVDWVDSVNAWVDLFGIYARIPADGNGNDSLGIIEKIDANYVWTEQEGNGPDIILPEVSSGDWGSGGVDAWYVAVWPRTPETKVSIETMLEIECSYCLNGEIEDPSDCEECEQEGVIWMRLEDTGFQLPVASNLQELENLRDEKTETNALSLDDLLSFAKKYDEAGKLDLAICFWHRAAEMGSARAMFNLGHVAREKGQPDLCESWWLKSAKLDYIDAAFSLGVFYKDAARISEAINWWERAAALGDSEASKAIGTFRSLGLDPNHPIDLELLTIDQLRMLANQYNKWGDSEKLIFYLDKLVKLGDVGAMNDLALEMSNQGNTHDAIALLLKAAESGHQVAMLNLGLAYLKESNYVQAKKWWTLASNLGNQDAKTQLEIMKRRGEDPDSVVR